MIQINTAGIKQQGRFSVSVCVCTFVLLGCFSVCVYGVSVGICLYLHVFCSSYTKLLSLLPGTHPDATLDRGEIQKLKG